MEWWNESWFWDWFDADGSRAGHCRIGLHPNQERAWLWFFLYDRGEWVAVEEPRLALADVARDANGLHYDRFGLRFDWRPRQPLRSGGLAVSGFGRVLAGPRVGMVLPLGARLQVEALGPPHSPGPARAAGHASDTTPASRFEQPIRVEGTLELDGRAQPFLGRGERDHSWGPRHWNLEWTFLVLNGENLRLQCSEALVPNVGRFAGGYLHRDETVSIEEVEFALSFQHERVLEPVSGRFSLKATDGSVVSGSLEPISAAEIDLTHTFVPPERSVYRRALLRAHLDAGGPPLLGWLEFNRFQPRA